MDNTNNDINSLINSIKKINIKDNSFNKNTNLLDKLLKRNNCYFDSKQFIEICNWCYSNIFNDKEKEKIWGNNILKKEKSTSQWTTLLGENIVCDVLKLLGHKNINTKTKRKDVCKNIIPDIETHSGIYEVKTRNWNTTGTAGEKVFGVPFKYADVPRIYGKPLYIVLVAAQEEKDNTQEIFSVPTPAKKKIIDFYESMNIYFIKFTDLLDKLNLKLKNDVKNIDNVIKIQKWYRNIKNKIKKN